MSSQFNRTRFVVHFICGAVLGVCAGFGSWIWLFDGGYLWVALPVSSLIFGLLAGFLGDSFWENIQHWIPWI